MGIYRLYLSGDVVGVIVARNKSAASAYAQGKYGAGSSAEPIVGRHAMLSDARISTVQMRSVHLTHAERDRAASLYLNALHGHPGMGQFVYGNYAWSNGSPLHGITVESFRSRNVILS